MSEFKFTCPHCGQHMLYDALWSGREITCPACQHMLVVPSLAPPAPAIAELVPTTPATAIASPPGALGRKVPPHLPPRIIVHKENDTATSWESEKADRGTPCVPPASEADALPTQVKLQATLGAERFVSPIAVVGLVVCVIGLKLGPGRKALGVVSEETSLLIGFGIGGGLLLCAALLWILIDNYYVLDRSSRRVFLHKGFRFVGSEAPFLEADDIIAVGLDCAATKRKGRQNGWSYTPVLLTRESGAIQLASLRTNMECDKLLDYNRRTRLWAAALHCYWVQCPTKQAFGVKDYFGKFEPDPNQHPAAS